MTQQKKPCSKDLEILELLKKHDQLSSIQIQNLAGIISHRDAVLRLRKGGYNIFSWRVNYVNSKGQPRWYMNYSLNKKAA